MDINLKNHIFLTARTDIDQIVSPVKNHFGFNYIFYIKHFNDGSEIRLSNHPAWTEFVYQNKLHTQCGFHTHPRHFKKEYMIQTSSRSFSAYCSAEYMRLNKEFDMDHDIMFINPCEDGCEFFSLNAPPSQPEIISRYVPHIDLLERFFVYFKERAAPLIQQALKQRIYIPNKYAEAPPLVPKESLNREAFLSALNCNHPLSPRETECAKLLMQGYTHKMIAQALGISHRTVNIHVEHIKDKIGAHSKAHMLQYISLNLH